ELGERFFSVGCVETLVGCDRYSGLLFVEVFTCPASRFDQQTERVFRKRRYPRLPILSHTSQVSTGICICGEGPLDNSTASFVITQCTVCGSLVNIRGIIRTVLDVFGALGTLIW